MLPNYSPDKKKTIGLRKLQELHNINNEKGIKELKEDVVLSVDRHLSKALVSYQNFYNFFEIWEEQAKASKVRLYGKDKTEPETPPEPLSTYPNKGYKEMNVEKTKLLQSNVKPDLNKKEKKKLRPNIKIKPTAAFIKASEPVNRETCKNKTNLTKKLQKSKSEILKVNKSDLNTEEFLHSTNYLESCSKDEIDRNNLEQNEKRNSIQDFCDIKLKTVTSSTIKILHQYYRNIPTIENASDSSNTEDCENVSNLKSTINVENKEHTGNEHEENKLDADEETEKNNARLRQNGKLISPDIIQGRINRLETWHRSKSKEPVTLMTVKELYCWEWVNKHLFPLEFNSKTIIMDDRRKPVSIISASSLQQLNN